MMRPNLIRLAGNLFSSTGAHGDSRRQLNLARPFTGHRPMTASMSTSIPIDVLKNTAKAKVEGEKFGEEKSQKDEQNMEAADKLLGSKIAIPSQHRAQEHEKWNKIEVMSPEEAEKLRAKYAQQADDKLVKEQGCGPNSFVSKTLILPYILRTRGADLEGNSITLCNFHDLYLANLLKKKGCKNITLVEKSFDNSQIIKNEIPKRFPDGEVKGLYGDAMLFLAYGKARHSRTYQRLLNRTNADKEIPLKLTYEERSDFRKSTPLLIYTIPLATKQMSMFTSLKRGLLQNLSGHDGLSMFNYGHFEFITFLHPVAYFTMTCKVDPEKRDNLGKRRNAYLFNKLFDVDVLRNTRIHLGCDHFSPKLEQYPWTKPEMFGTIPAPIIAVSIRSRSAIRIGGYPVMNDAEDNSETAVLSTNELLKFCFLISEVALKENAKRTAEELFGILCGDKGRAVAKGLDLTKVSTVPNEALEEAFIELRSELQVPIDWKVTETML